MTAAAQALVLPRQQLHCPQLQLLLRLMLRQGCKLLLGLL
jgi:hypothetical protein